MYFIPLRTFLKSSSILGRHWYVFDVVTIVDMIPELVLVWRHLSLKQIVGSKSVHKKKIVKFPARCVTATASPSF